MNGAASKVLDIFSLNNRSAIVTGAIINIGSMSGDIVNGPSRQAAYNASKAAVRMLTSDGGYTLR